MNHWWTWSCWWYADSDVSMAEVNEKVDENIFHDDATRMIWSTLEKGEINILLLQKQYERSERKKEHTLFKLFCSQRTVTVTAGGTVTEASMAARLHWKWKAFIHSGTVVKEPSWVSRGTAARETQFELLLMIEGRTSNALKSYIIYSTLLN